MKNEKYRKNWLAALLTKMARSAGFKPSTIDAVLAGIEQYVQSMMPPKSAPVIDRGEAELKKLTDAHWSKHRHLWYGFWAALPAAVGSAFLVWWLSAFAIPDSDTAGVPEWFAFIGTWTLVALFTAVAGIVLYLTFRILHDYFGAFDGLLEIYETSPAPSPVVPATASRTTAAAVSDASATAERVDLAKLLEPIVGKVQATPSTHGQSR